MDALSAEKRHDLWLVTSCFVMARLAKSWCPQERLCGGRFDTPVIAQVFPENCCQQKQNPNPRIVFETEDPGVEMPRRK